jgi:pimeloyl-ACP methyl ester carboxylesterase
LVQWLAGRVRLPKTSPLYRHEPFPLRQVIGLGSIGDLRRRAVALKEVCGLDMPRLTGEPGASRRDVFADTSPVELMPNGSHTVLINGDRDHVSPPQTAVDYAALASQAGDQVDTIVLPNASHFDEVSAAAPAWSLILPVIRRALGC